MKLRRWEVWLTGTENGEPYGQLATRCFTKWGAHLAASTRQCDRLSPLMVALWNERWPDRQLSLPTYSVCRRQ